MEKLMLEDIKPSPRNLNKRQPAKTAERPGLSRTRFWNAAPVRERISYRRKKPVSAWTIFFQSI